jgi:hypothetical protein
MINKKFAEVFGNCYKKLVDRSKATSDRLKKRLDNLNERMLSATVDDEPQAVSRPGLERSDTEMIPTFQQRPNYLLTDQIVGDVKTFISLLLKLAKDFYTPVVKEIEIVEMREDLVESITNIVLSREVYKIVFSFFRLEFSDLEQDLRDRFKEFTKLTPGECRVNEYFRCDATSPILKIHKDIINKDMFIKLSEPMSINYDNTGSIAHKKNDKFKSFIEERKYTINEIEEETKEPINHDAQDPSTLERNSSYRRSRSFDLVIENKPSPRAHRSRRPKVWEIENRLRQKPFNKAIAMLKKIDEREGPMMKVRLLENVNTLIKTHIEEFWKDIPIDNSHLTITQDTKIPLYIYIVIKSKLVNLAAHIKFIQEFTTSYIHESYLGSNLALYESAMTIVADKKRNTIYNVVDQNEVYKQKNAQYLSFATSVFNEDIDPFVDFYSSFQSKDGK